MIAAEARRKLMADIRFSFDRLFTSDIQGRARAFKSLIDGSMDPAQVAKATDMADG